MPSIVVRRQRVKRANRDYRMVIMTEDGAIVLGVPFAPRDVQYGGLATRWTEIERPARQAILADAGGALATMSFELIIANARDRPVEGILTKLRQLADTADRLIVSYGPSEAGLWHLSELGIQAMLRHPDTDEITRAAASLTFTEVSDYNVSVSPLTGGSKGPGKQKIPGTYVVKKGDTLHEIANQFYGDPKWWRAIADENKIREPRNDAKLNAGRKLKLPRRSELQKSDR